MSWSALADVPVALASYTAAVAQKAFASPNGSFSATSLLVALLIAGAFVSWQRHRNGRRRLALRVLVRALLPKKLLNSPSGRADLAFMAFNVFLFGLLFGWAVLSGQVIATGVRSGLAVIFGGLSPTTLPPAVVMVAMTVALFLAYELAYWTDHYLSHSIPFLWEFHKVHHSAEVLSPLTNARVHPVDTIVFYNITALVMGTVGGLMQYALGQPATELTLFGTNAIAFLFGYTTNHLQHSHMWIAFTGWWGRLVLSPAHHQIHHSTSPAHFNKNLGSSLAIFDWLFGTLHIPARQREKLTFGVEAGSAAPHTVEACLIEPVRNALGHVMPTPRRHPASEPVPRQPQA